MTRSRRLAALCLTLIATLELAGCRTVADVPEAIAPFTIAVIPDTQNYLDYGHQRSEGFAIDSVELFLTQMQRIAERSAARGGDIVFVASVGDVWQHQSRDMDPEHAARGFVAIANPFFAQALEATPRTRAFEIPKAIQGYRLLHAAGLPFGVAPGNHDYDAMWSDSRFPPAVRKSPRDLRMTPDDLGMLHIGGLDNFRRAFGADTEFFDDEPWYVSSFAGGANSAQVFEGGGYRFLHFALQMQAPDEVLDWARGVMARYPGLPTIVTTHDYLDTHGERAANPIVDLDRIDPEEHNSAEELWAKLIAPNDQIFLVLCGHHHGQSRRIDANAHGNPVVQVLADYQDRGQAGLDAGQSLDPRRRRPVGIGDGWMRLMRFELGGAAPRIVVTTWSSHYGTNSSGLATYADWYKAREQPQMSDAEFHAADEFEIPLSGFRQRFGAPSAD